MDLEVKIPFSRLTEAAMVFGSQECTSCPPVEGDHTCFLRRTDGAKPFLPESVEHPKHYECVECWLRFFTNGD
jgi:hypothetical protein